MDHPIFFVHTGSIPQYLYKSLRQARFANPDSPIFLLTDGFAEACRSLGCTVLDIKKLHCEKSRQFNALYKHHSSNPEPFEKFCFLRWFYLQQAMQMLGIKQALHLDSDCMLFGSTREVFANHARADITVSSNGSPHCCIIKNGLGSYLDYITNCFSSVEIMKEFESRFKSQSDPETRWVLSDMTLFFEFGKSQKTGAFHDYLHENAVIDRNMSEAEGFVPWPGKKCLKRVFWEISGGALVPHFKSADQGRLRRALALHFKGAAKRRMRHFNAARPTSSLTLGVKRFFFNRFPPINAAELLKF